MRREKNQYIFASELTKRNRSHHFRVAFLVFLPLLILILCVMSIAIISVTFMEPGSERNRRRLPRRWVIRGIPA